VKVLAIVQKLRRFFHTAPDKRTRGERGRKRERERERGERSNQSPKRPSLLKKHELELKWAFLDGCGSCHEHTTTHDEVSSCVA
jgi:hypothetical protein